VVTVHDQVVSWAWVAGAKDYTVNVNGQNAATVTENTYDLSEYNDGTYTVRVAANPTDTVNYATSSWSNTGNVVVKTPEPVKLVAPTLSVNGTTTSWSAVDGTQDYTVNINGIDIERTANRTWNFSEYVDGTYTIRVAANPADTKTHLPSDWSNSGSVTIKAPDPVKLAAPTLYVNGTTTTWNYIPGAQDYTVNVNNQDVARVAENTYSLSDYADGTYNVRVAANPTDTKNYLQSNWSNAQSVTIKTQEPNPDKYDTPFALRDALLSFAQEITGCQLTAQEQQSYGQRLEQIYIAAWSRDSYSKNFPFNSNHLKQVFEHVDFRLWYGQGSYSDSRTWAQIETRQTAEQMVGTIIHEVGHCLGLGEALTQMATAEYRGVSSAGRAVHVNPLYVNLLKTKVGETAFWNKVYEGSNAKYGEMWDANMTVLDTDNVRRPLLTHDQFERVKHLDLMRLEQGINAQYKKSVEDFAKFSGIPFDGDYYYEFLTIFASNFEAAMNGNRNAITQVRQFSDAVERFNAQYKILEINNFYSRTVNEHSRIFDFFKTPVQQKLGTSTINGGVANMHTAGQSK